MGCGSKNEVEAFSLELEIESIYTNTQHHNSSLCAFCMSRLEVMWYERLTPGTPGLLKVTVYGVWLEHWVVSQLPGVHG